jgi:putative FmdB family regulatory protein
MPTYRFKCTVCDHTQEEYKAMSECGLDSKCLECDSPAQMLFTPNRNLYVPRHFQFSSDWHMPDKDDKAAWANIGTTDEKRSQTDHSFDGFLKREGYV